MERKFKEGDIVAYGVDNNYMAEITYIEVEHSGVTYHTSTSFGFIADELTLICRAENREDVNNAD
jgi:hypothetical protein